MTTQAPLKEALKAISEGQLASLRKAVQASPGLAAHPRLINEAALHGSVKIVEYLLGEGADPDALSPSHERYRPLHRAIEHRGVKENAGHRRTVEILLKAGASLTLRATWMQLTALGVAGMAGKREIIPLLLQHGAELDVFAAAVTADFEGVARFLHNGVLASQGDENNMTLLHYVTLSGMKEADEPLQKIASLLLENGADGDAAHDIGPYKAIPPLHFAAWNESAVAKVLLEHGCKPNGGFGNTLWRKPGALAELFLAHGADVNLREPSGETLLHSRIRWNLPAVVLWLLEKGADPGLTDAKGNTALHEAAARGINAQVVQALLDHGAGKKRRNAEGATALDIALAKKRTKLVPLLR